MCAHGIEIFHVRIAGSRHVLDPLLLLTVRLMITIIMAIASPRLARK